MLTIFARKKLPADLTSTHLLELALFNETLKIFYDLEERYTGARLSLTDLRS